MSCLLQGVALHPPTWSTTTCMSTLPSGLHHFWNSCEPASHLPAHAGRGGWQNPQLLVHQAGLEAHRQDRPPLGDASPVSFSHLLFVGATEGPALPMPSSDPAPACRLMLNRSWLSPELLHSRFGRRNHLLVACSPAVLVTPPEGHGLAAELQSWRSMHLCRDAKEKICAATKSLWKRLVLVNMSKLPSHSTHTTSCRRH